MSRRQSSPFDAGGQASAGATSSPDPRPALHPPLEALLASIIRSAPPLEGIRASDVLVVSASAHGTVAASVRSLVGCAHSVVVAGQPRRWEIALRPIFFQEGDAARRVGTLVHELLHLDPDRPGQLLEAARHRRRSHEAHERIAQQLAQDWLARGEVRLLAPLGHDGEVLMRQWRVRPVPETRERAFGDADLYVGPVRLHTPPDRRTVWW